MSYKIICYGDSNTYGYDARSFMGGRLPKEERWTGILDASGDYQIVNEGENGREIPTDRWELGELSALLNREAPFDLLVIMLGTNDLLTMHRTGLEKIADRMETLLYELKRHPAISGSGSKILLIAPPPTDLSLLDPSASRFDSLSRDFGRYYGPIAAASGVHFANAGQWHIQLGRDGVHFSARGHQRFAEHMLPLLRRILA